MRDKKILIVEHEETTHRTISQALHQEGFKADILTCGIDVIQQVQLNEYALIIMAVLLPDINGIELCQKVRQFSDIPIIFVSKKTDDTDIILGLEVGGDDYMTKPFSPVQLVARVKANIRRSTQAFAFLSHSQEHNRLTFQGLSIDLATHTTLVDGKEVMLSPKEFDLLVVLAKHPHRVFYIEELYRYIWGSDSLGDARTIIVHISNLRRKIEQSEANPKYIITVRGKGYKFNPMLQLKNQ